MELQLSRACKALLQKQRKQTMKNQLKQLYSEMRHNLLDFKESQFVRVVHLFDKANPQGGLTIAYKPQICTSAGFPKGKFAEVSLAWCNPKDRYDRKLGELIALNKLERGESVLVPIYAYGAPVLELKRMFEPQRLW